METIETIQRFHGFDNKIVRQSFNTCHKSLVLLYQYDSVRMPYSYDCNECIAYIVYDMQC